MHCKILGGSILMAGRSGMGQNLIVRFVAYMHQIQVVNLRVSRSYTLKHFTSDLKDV